MSSLTELTISGIRAFDNHDSQSLVFNTPLTLICGANGVGKTTVIECLRYVTTGDLPPNSKGGAFVHDPKMSSKSSVKAQVRLKFRDFKGRPMQAARSMQLTVSKKNVYSMKTLDGYLTADLDASRVPASQLRKSRTGDPSLDIKSARNADLNLLIPQSLGIPPAILNYVMFCHQEDSQWPLAEASQVKKRFDDIFEATRYTKALDSLKSMRKDYAVTSRLDEAEVQHLKQDEQRVAEKWKQVRNYEQQQFELSQTCVAMRAEHAKLVSEHGKALEHGQWMQQLEYAEKDAQTQLDRTLQDIEMLQADISEPDLAKLSEQDLQTQCESVDSYESELAKELQQKRADLARIAQQIEDFGSNLAGLTNKQGRLQEMMNANAQRITKRHELVAADDSAVNEWNEKWMQTQRQEIARLKAAFERVEIENRQTEEKISTTLNEFEAQRLQLRQQLSTLNTNIQKGDSKISELRAELKLTQKNEFTGDSETLLKDRIQVMEGQLVEATKRKEDFEQEISIPKLSRDVKEAEIVADECRKLVQTAINASDTMNRLNFLRDSDRELQTQLQAVSEELEEAAKLSEIDIPARSAETENTKKYYSDLETKINDSLASMRSVVENTTSDVAKLRSQLELGNTMTDQAQTKLGELEQQRTAVLKKLEPVKEKLEISDTESNSFDGYESLLQGADDELMEATEQEEQLQFAHSFFNRALSLAEKPENPVCLLCEHHKTPKEASSLVKKLKAKIMAFSITPEEAQKMTEQAREAATKLRSYQPMVENVRRLNDEITTLSDDITNNLKKRSADLELQIEALEGSLKQQQSSLDSATGRLKPLLTKLNRLSDESNKISAKLDLERSLFINEKDQVSPHEAQQRQEDADSALKTARRHLEDANATERRIQQEVYNVTNGVKELKLKLNEVQHQAAARKRLEEEISKELTNKDQLTLEMREIEASFPEVDAKLKQEQENLRSLKFKSAQIEKDMATQRNAKVSLVEKIEQLTAEIERFELQHGEDPLGSLQTEIEKLNIELADSKQRSGDISSVVDDLVTKQSNSGSHRRNISDMLRIKKLHRKADDYTQKLTKAKAEMAEAKQSSEHQDWETKISDLQAQIDILDREVSAKTGESKAIGQHISEIRHELDTTYMDTHDKYHEALSKLETNKGVIGDLEKYVKVMDSAIMRYHSNKMSQINSLLDQMWRQTYTGTDIDTILIRSESDPGSTSARANYNYRVCMVKRDTELDMRGRCSAGQKVLASIIIRMVLAESFGPSSGLIVLDEPTTNLDTQNISALAQSLNEIIGSRIAQRNFQLIVITHDEHFLSLMNPADFCEDYYLIKRDSKQLSRIERMPISSLGYGS